MDNLTAQELLKDVVGILEKNQIPYCLAFGTLLGAVRDHEIMEHDTDIDIGIFNNFWADEDLFQKVAMDFLDKNIIIYNLAANHVMNLGREKIPVDLYYHKKEIDTYSIRGAGWKLQLPSHYFTPLNQIEFLGQKFYIPNHVEEYLAELYTETWKEKISHKDTKYGLMEDTGKRIKTITFTNFLYIYEKEK